MNKIDTSSCGCQQYGQETLDAIQAHGSVILKGTNVVNWVSVNGSLMAVDAVVAGGIAVNGQVDLRNCLINNTTCINGSLNADNTEFQKELSIASQKITLKSCSVDSLTLRKMPGYDGIQVIDLRNGTLVRGPLIVESGKGEIWLSSNSRISDQIKGAQVKVIP